MTLLTVGMSHKTAPVAERERWVLLPEQLPAILGAIKAETWVEESAIVSTCNRVEFYLKVSDPNADLLLDQWSQTLEGSRQALAPLVYQYHDDAVVKHLLRVACGLDSMVLGEPQILGQMKEAYRQADQMGTLGKHLRYLFDFGFKVAKQVRTETEIGLNPVSVASTAVQLAKRIFTDLSQKRVLLIGAGETIELVAQHLRSAGVTQMKVANRTLERAKRLADKMSAQAMVLSEIPQHLATVDIVLSSTGSPLPIIGKGVVEAAMTQRKYQSMLMIDLAVPRDIEAAVHGISKVFVYTVDDLESVIADHRSQRLNAADDAETLIAYQAEQYRLAVQSWQAHDTVRAYRSSLEALAQAEMEKVLKALNNEEDQAAVLQRYGYNLINKIMHPPTIALRRLAQQGDTEQLQIARNILLEHNLSEHNDTNEHNINDKKD